MILREENSTKDSLKMVKNRRELTTPRRRNSLVKGRAIAKTTSRPASAASSAPALPAANIQVVVRVRPPNSKEQCENSRVVVKVIGDQMLIFDPKEDQQNFFFHGVQQKSRDLLKRANKDLKFIFDKVFANSSTTEEVFKDSTYSLIDSLMDGCNCSVFAYGATGAGKTYTMTGSTETPGITFLTMTELFRKQEELSFERDFELGITYLEVYNELVKDLLNPGPPLNLREDSTYGVTVAGIKVYKINSPDELFSLLEQGNKNRTQHPTDANAESSRSHAVFQVYIQMTLKATQEIRRAKLSMIDLAGSERGSATGYGGARFTEGANINKSLLALGNCINSLADGHRHVPYRDSKLTRLLKDSLGGNCRTVMIANVSPSSLSFEDTYNTLKYATRAKKIKTNIKRNVVNVEMHMGHYVEMVEQFKKENSMLKRQLEEEKNQKAEVIENLNGLKNAYEKLKKKVEEAPDLSAGKKSFETDSEIVQRIDTLIKEIETCVMRENQLDYNKATTLKRRTMKEKINSVIDSVCMNTPERENFHKKINHTVSRCKKQEEIFDNELDLNNKALEEFNAELMKINEEYPEYTHYINAQLSNIKLKHNDKVHELAEKQVDSLEKENERKTILLEQMAPILKSCYLQLKAHGFVTKALTKQYQQVTQDFGKKNVKFDEGPDSGISSTTSISDDENRTNNNKRKMEDPSPDLDGTFTMTSSTPNKPKSKGIAADQIISKVIIKPPPPKRLANGRISPRNKENKPFMRLYDTSRALTAAKANTALKALSKTPTKPATLANRPRFRS